MYENKHIHWMRTAADEVVFLVDHVTHNNKVQDLIDACIDHSSRYAATTGKVPVAVHSMIGTCLAAAELISVAPRSELAEAIHVEMGSLYRGDVRVALVKFVQALWPECFKLLEQFDFERCFKEAP